MGRCVTVLSFAPALFSGVLQLKTQMGQYFDVCGNSQQHQTESRISHVRTRPHWQRNKGIKEGFSLPYDVLVALRTETQEARRNYSFWGREATA